MLLTYFAWALVLGITAVIYKNFLAHEEVLNWWFRFGARFEKRWFYKPIWGCVYCISGQLALWVYILNWIQQVNFIKNSFLSDFLSFLAPKITPGSFSLLGAAIFICTVIFLVHILDRYYNKTFDN